VEPSNVWLLNKLQQLLLDVEKSQKDIAGLFLLIKIKGVLCFTNSNRPTKTN